MSDQLISQSEVAVSPIDPDGWFKLVTRIAVQFINQPPDQVDATIVESIRQVVQGLGIDRGAIWQFGADGVTLSHTHLWQRAGIPPAPARVSPAVELPWIYSRVVAGETTWVSALDEVPDATDRATLGLLGNRSAAVIPLTRKGTVIGAVSFGSLARTVNWTQEIRERLDLVAAVFSQALAQAVGELKLRSTLDELGRLRDRLAMENVQLKQQVQGRTGPGTIASESPAARHALAQVDLVAARNASVLLLGETGCGKELFAEAIHARSDRRDRPMIRVNCAAIPTALLESELFGRERGAYTGALSRQIGRFEMADGSTLFLDEVGDLSLEAQAKLLRVLQERVIERLGSAKPIRLDVRIIAATNRDLAQAVASGTFREDLYYRLNVFPITVPPLRERPEDIPILAWMFVDEFSRAYNQRIDSISRESLAALQRYPWPGNIRELRNVIERAVIVARDPHLVVDLPKAMSQPQSVPVTIADLEAGHIRDVLQSTGWRIRGPIGAASILGVKPTTLESRMLKLGIRRPRRVPTP